MRILAAPLLGLAIALVALSVAWAQSPTVAEQTNWFKTHDRNGDGYITYEEVIGYELKLFKRSDKNGDGKLSESEFMAGVPKDQPAVYQRYKRRFLAMDKDHDGFVTVREMEAYYKSLIKAADKKGDGHVSLQEWLDATERE
jgi:Ca2+-binding EF-hand superfamily protein